MANNSHLWAPANISDITFHNCTIASTWFISFVKTRHFPFPQTVEMLHDGLSGHVNSTNATLPSYGETVDFFWSSLNAQNSSLLRNMQQFAGSNCSQDVCPHLGWQGNPDLFGPGMLVTYFAQSILTTVYAPAFLASPPEKRQYPRNQLLERGRSAVVQSTRVFLDGSLVMCLTMLIAAIMSLSQTRLTAYSTALTAMLSVWSIGPPLVLNIAALEIVRRAKWRMCIWITIILLGLVVIVLHSFANSSKPFDYFKEADPGLQLTWEYWCIKPKEKDSSYDFYFWYVGPFSPWIWSWWMILDFTTPTTPKVYRDRRDGCLAFLIFILRLFGVSLCLAGMWVTLTYTIFLWRNRVGWDRGAENKEKDWSFGQILVLSTWIPVIIELVFIWKQGPKEALTGLMMKQYRAEEVPGPADGSRQGPTQDSAQELLEPPGDLLYPASQAPQYFTHYPASWFTPYPSRWYNQTHEDPVH